MNEVCSTCLPEAFDLYADCRLELSVDISPNYGEPSDHQIGYEGRIYSGGQLEWEVGNISLSIVDLPKVYFNGESPLELLDGIDADHADFCDLLTLTGAGFKPSIQRMACAAIERLLIIKRINIAPDYRGYDLGLSAINLASERLGEGALTVLKAFPLQWEDRVAEDPKAFRKDMLRLMKHYRRAGFMPYLDKGLMVRPSKKS